MKILFIGDTHGELFDLQKLLAMAKSNMGIEIAIQVGDFGFFPNIIQNLIHQNVKFPIPLFAIDGNHENHEMLFEASQKEKQLWKEKLNLTYVSRGSVLNFDKTKIGFLGGALHVDRPQERTEHYTNYVSDADLELAIRNFNSNSNSNKENLDLIVTHSCPMNIGVGRKSNPIFDYGVASYIRSLGIDPGDKNDCGEEKLTRLWNSLTVRPKAWIYGHFHLNHMSKVDETSFIGLAEMKSNGYVIWDTTEKNFVWL